MIVIAIMGILASISIPIYETFRMRAQFAEVILATSQYKTPADIAFQLGDVTITELESGSYGIPKKMTGNENNSTYISSIEMKAGKIEATATSDLKNATYVLEATAGPAGKGITWKTDISNSSCVDLGICAPVK